MELEVGQFARTLNGIVKIDKIQNGVMKDTKGCLHYGDFIKASHNIIDLIEPGDYINGYKVDFVQNNEIIYNHNHPRQLNMFAKDIKSIVTREQFKAIEYIYDEDILKILKEDNKEE